MIPMSGSSEAASDRSWQPAQLSSPGLFRGKIACFIYLLFIINNIIITDISELSPNARDTPSPRTQNVVFICKLPPFEVVFWCLPHRKGMLENSNPYVYDCFCVH